MRLAGVKTLLSHPLTRGLDLDAPETTARRREIIRRKPFLRRLYDEWYTQIARELPASSGPVLELGSGAGHLREHVAELVTSDVMLLPGIHLVAGATRLPIRDGVLRGIVMINVLHHVADVAALLRESARVTRIGGRMVLLEPWVSRWSRVVYRALHHEPFDADAREWTLGAGGPLTAANSALPWIVFVRDRHRFEEEFREWRVRSIVPLMPLRYVLSGGVSLRSFMPAWSFAAWRWVDNALLASGLDAAMFALVVLERREPDA